jgi:hypothetical protein
MKKKTSDFEEVATVESFEMDDMKEKKKNTGPGVRWKTARRQHTNWDLMIRWMYGKKSRNRVRFEKSYILQQLLKWIGPIVKREIVPDTAFMFFKSIENGELLCLLINNVGPDHVHISHVATNCAAQSHQAKVNIKKFLSACKQLGVLSPNLFKVEDLVERNNDRRVVRTLIYLAIALIPYDQTPPPFIARYLEHFNVRIHDAPRLNRVDDLFSSPSKEKTLDEEPEAETPMSPEKRLALMERLHAKHVASAMAADEINEDEPASLSTTDAPLMTSDSSGGGMWDLLSNSEANPKSTLPALTTPEKTEKKKTRKQRKKEAEEALFEKQQQEKMAQQKVLNTLMKEDDDTPPPEKKVEVVPTSTKYSEKEWQDLTQHHLDVTSLIVAQGDETTLDKPTVASILFPAFLQPLNYDGLDVVIEDARHHASKWANRKAKLEYRASRLSDKAVKRWNRRAANVRMDIKRWRAGNMIASRPGRVMAGMFTFCILCLLLIFIPVYHPIYFDISVEQFRVESAKCTKYYDYYNQGYIDSWANYPNIVEEDITSSKVDAESFDSLSSDGSYVHPADESDAAWWHAFTPSGLLANYQRQVAEHNHKRANYSPGKGYKHPSVQETCKARRAPGCYQRRLRNGE